jgi:hypothetical protein
VRSSESGDSTAHGRVAGGIVEVARDDGACGRAGDVAGVCLGNVEASGPFGVASHDSTESTLTTRGSSLVGVSIADARLMPSSTASLNDVSLQSSSG